LQNVDRTRLRQNWFDAEMPERHVLVFAAEVSGGIDPLRFRRTSEYRRNLHRPSGMLHHVPFIPPLQELEQAHD
jgi:hypothetical protein